MDLRLYSMAWTVIYPVEDDDYTHVVPAFGPTHEDSIRCWCGPAHDTEDQSILIHNAVH